MNEERELLVEIARERYPIGTFVLNSEQQLLEVTEEVYWQMSGISHVGIPYVYHPDFGFRETYDTDKNIILPKITKEEAIEQYSKKSNYEIF